MDDGQKSNEIAKIIITNAETYGFLSLSAEGKYQLAISYYLQGNCTKAINGFNEAKVEFEQVGNIERVADTLTNSSNCLTNNEEALALLLQALTLAQQLDNKDLMANILNSIGLPELEREPKQKLITEGSSLETIRHMVASGLGISVLPQSAAMKGYYDENLLEVRPFETPVPYRSVALAWRVTFPRPKAIDLLAMATKKCKVLAADA